MRLEVLGPGFGLPSIDAECNAAVALLQSHCRPAEQAWELAAGYEDHALPALRVGDQVYHGFKSISDRLGGIALSERQQADLTTLGAFIESNGQPLLDISLYVSYENYSSRTRPAFTRILPWHANYIIPPRRRKAALSRTEHLGVSSLDMDDLHESVIDKPQNQGQNTFEHATEKRARTLLGRRETVRSMLEKPEYAGAFKLKALADAFFQPLAEQLADRRYLLDTDSPTSVDCLAFGYLSLMLVPRMVQSWLADILRAKYPRLEQYVQRMATGLGIETEGRGENATAGQVPATLPWAPATAESAGQILSFIGRDALGRLPSLLQPTSLQASDADTLQQYLPGFLVLASTTVAVLGYWVHQRGMWPRGEAVQIFGRKRLADYGAAGTALSVLGGQVRAESAYQEQQRHEAPLEVAVVVDDQAVT